MFVEKNKTNAGNWILKCQHCTKVPGECKTSINCLALNLMWDYLIFSIWPCEYIPSNCKQKTRNASCVSPQGVPIVYVSLPQFGDLPEVKFKKPQMFWFPSTIRPNWFSLAIAAVRYWHWRSHFQYRNDLPLTANWQCAIFACESTLISSGSRDLSLSISSSIISR